MTDDHRNWELKKAVLSTGSSLDKWRRFFYEISDNYTNLCGLEAAERRFEKAWTERFKENGRTQSD